MRRALATVELIEDDDGSVSARVDGDVALDDRARRAVVRAVAVALDVVESEAEWDAAWEAEIAARRASLADGTARAIAADDVIARLESIARGTAR
jgi:hypothetical protein